MGENQGDHQSLKKPHFIIIPPPFQGHINPSVQLTLKLASRGFTVTFVNTEFSHDQIRKSRKHISNGEDDDDDIFAGSLCRGAYTCFPAHVDDLVGQLMDSDSPPTCLVADSFSTWGSAIAWKHGLVNVSFWTQPAIVFMLYYHLDLLKKNGHYGSKVLRKDTIDYIPGVAAIEPRDLTSFLQETDTSTVMHRLIEKAFKDAKNADLIIMNTAEELEPGPISALKEKHPTYAIGPIFPSHFTNRAVEMNLWSESDCTRWLDTKPPGSVLYASFGSFAHSNKEDIETIANGLLLSGVSFIWVLRPDIVSSKVKDFLPNGFQENVGNKGDQTTNRKLVVDDWKIGIDLCKGKLVSSDEVAERIKFVMSEETSNEFRKNVIKLRKKLENALGRNGTSQMNFDKFVEDVKDRTERRNKKF
ncbi:UNVERIFIED_CONTAM: UDP-glycosyltransferase 86A1 [Sesamum latifolium]|uniref:UDP-glycosyltransferase 86A1 n=1 Tax=Sesamum latifolium TaxID=2727402 RepID=A0AAW2TYM4_9LAMI